jgi:hypothetical protein
LLERIVAFQEHRLASIVDVRPKSSHAHVR